MLGVAAPVLLLLAPAIFLPSRKPFNRLMELWSWCWGGAGLVGAGHQLLAESVYGDVVLELTVDFSVEQVLQECERRGLVVRRERDLGGCPGGRHWHLHIPGRAGTLELNECRGRVSVKVHPRRDGGWARALAADLHAMSRA